MFLLVYFSYSMSILRYFHSLLLCSSVLCRVLVSLLPPLINYRKMEHNCLIRREAQRENITTFLQFGFLRNIILG